MSAECEVGERKEKKSLGRSRYCVALQTFLHCSPTEEMSPSHAFLSLPHSAPHKVLGKSATEGCLS